MEAPQLRQMLRQLSPAVPIPPQLTPTVAPVFPASQTDLVRNSQATAAANTFLQQAGIQNLPHRVSDAPSVFPTRAHYPTPASTLPLQQPILAQQLLQLFQNQPQLSSTLRAIQLADFIPASSVEVDQKLIASRDGSIKLIKPQQMFFEVSLWAAMAMTSILKFSQLAAANNPRVVKFNLHEYVSYLEETFLLFHRFEFKQVLLHDRAYRTLQLREGWKWGTHVPSLFQFHLAGRTKPHTRSLVNTQRSVNAVTMTCATFNKGGVCNFHPCKFLHTCAICKLSHPATQCPSVQPKSS